MRIDCNTITGSMPFTYEWRREGVLLANPNPPNSLVVTQAGSYMCTVRNSFGDDSATSQIQGMLFIKLSGNAIICFSLCVPSYSSSSQLSNHVQWSH